METKQPLFKGFGITTHHGKMFSKITSQFQNQYYQSLIHTYGSYRTEGLKIAGAFTPNLDRVFITPLLVSKSPEQVSGAIIRQGKTEGNLTIWDFLAAAPLEPTYRRVLLLGPLGSGKTKLLEHITLSYAQNNQRQHNPKAPKLVPVLLSLSQVSQILHEQPADLPRVIGKILEGRKGVKLDVPIQWFEEKLTQGKCLVMLDGLDDLKIEADRTLVGKWLDSQMSTYVESVFIITSRPDAYRHNPMAGLRFCLELQPFNLKQAQKFFEHWYLEDEVLRQAHKHEQSGVGMARTKARNLLRRLKKSFSLVALTTNPLLLSVILNFEEHNCGLPEKRGQLYQKILDLLLEERDQDKAILGRQPLKKVELQYLLQVLALGLMVRQISEFNLKIGAEILSESLGAINTRKLGPQGFFYYIETRTGILLHSKPGVYRFAHLGFQHYLAATQVKMGRQEQILIENMQNPWWAETILLYAAQADCTLLILAAWKERNVVSLTLAYDCLREGQNIGLDLREKLDRWLNDALESEKPLLASLAARVTLLRRLK